jgi:hypothetical protein
MVLSSQATAWQINNKHKNTAKVTISGRKFAFIVNQVDLSNPFLVEIATGVV